VILQCLSGFGVSPLTFTIIAAAFFPGSPVAHAQEDDLGSSQSPEAVVRELYELVTFPAGETLDYDGLRGFFLPEAVVVLRTSPASSSVFTLEGFVADWVRFIDDYDVVETGFAEKVIRTHCTEMGDIAHVWVLYEAEIPGRGRPAQPGVDSFQLVRREEGWKIASVINEIPTPDRPIPEVLRDPE